MHPITTPEQSIQFAADHIRKLRVEATTWRQARRASRSTRETHRRAA